MSSTSVFRDYFIRCLPPTSHYQRQGNFFFLATTTGPGVVATIYSNTL